MRLPYLLLAVLLVTAGCQIARDLRPVIGNSRRVPRSTLEGEFVFLKSLTRVTSAAPGRRELVPGVYLEKDRIVRFAFRENQIDIVAKQPAYVPARGSVENPVLATLDARWVDLRQKQNADGQDTHEQEETDSWRTYDKRGFAIIDFTRDGKDTFRDETTSADMPTGISVDGDAINVDVVRQLRDGTSVSVRYSFRRYRRDPTYVRREYPRELQLRFGFFKTTHYGRDSSGRVVTANRTELLNRWNLAAPIAFRYTANFPNRLKPVVAEVFETWNRALRDATNRPPEEPDLLPPPLENNGETLGDLRYNLIHYDDTPDSAHRILAYAPRTVNPETGQILKGDIVVFGSTIGRTIHAERLWAELFPRGAEDALREPVEGSMPGADRLLREVLRPSGRPGTLFRDPRFPATPNESLLTLVRSQFTPDQARAALLREASSDLASHATAVPPGVSGVLSRFLREGLSDHEMEARLVKPLFSHEVGHPLGLRHNFMGSADVRHYAEDSHSSSIMDYPFLHTHDEMLIGPYDVAALRQLYGSDGVSRTLLGPPGPRHRAATPAMEGHVPYLFCTDPGPEDLYAPRNPLCEPFDAGASLAAAVENHKARYRASYLFNNTRLDEVSFPVRDEEYLSRVAAELVPLRVIYDHSNAVLAAYANREYGRLWRLLRQRIEADPIPVRPPDQPAPADPNVHVEAVPDQTRYQVRPGGFEPHVVTVERRIDRRRLASVVNDARVAKVTAFRALADIVRAPSTPTRPDTLALDPTFNEPQRRGVLPDKLLALMLAGARTIDPIGDGEYTAPFWTMRYDVPAVSGRLASDLFSDLIANLSSTYVTETQVFGGRAFRAYDGSLRELAAHLLARDIATHRRGVDARRMLALTVSPVHAPTWQRRRLLQATVRTFPGRLAAITAQMALAPTVGFGSWPILAHSQGTILTLQTERAEAERELRNIDADTRPEARQDERWLDAIDAFRPDRLRLGRRLREINPADGVAVQQIRASLRDREEARNRIPVAFAVEAAGERFLRAPCVIEGLPFVPGTCLLLRDNVNVLELGAAAAAEQIAGVEARLAQARAIRPAIPARIRELEDEAEDYRAQLEYLRQYLAGEMDFAAHLMNDFSR